MSRLRARRSWLAGLILGAGLLGSGFLAVDAAAAPATAGNALVATDSAARATAQEVEDEDEDDAEAEDGDDAEDDGQDGCDAAETEGEPGAIDDGREFLPEAEISLAEAIAAAQAAATGAIGEVDLERVDSRLVFNVDVGDKDVKVDATTGQVVSVDDDD